MNSIDFFKVDDLLNKIEDIQKRLTFYQAKGDKASKAIVLFQNDIDVLNKRKQMIENAKQYYLKVVDLCYMHSIEEMEDFVNHVLGYVFYDESYKIKLDISNKHSKSLTFYLINENKDLETPLRKGNGKGVKAVVSFILLTYYLLKMKSKYIFLDETFVNISEGYISRFFEYIKLLCNKYNMCIALITHDTRFPEFADIIYEVKHGVVKRCI